MRPMRLRAINFATHQDTEIRLRHIEAAVILGMNGSGKSSMMIDCLLVSVFGKGRTGDLDNYIKLGTTMMTAEADVLVNSRYYRTIRKRSKKTSRGETLLEFYEIDSLGNELINLTQGTIGDTQSLILRTYGTDFDTVCRTNILEQGEADYFCKATPAERMALFSQVWDLEKYDEMAQLEKEEVAVIKEKIRMLDETRAACINKLDALDKDREELEVLKRLNVELSRTVDSLERKKEKAEKALAKYETLAEQEKKLDEGIRKINVDLEKVGEQHQSLLTRIARYEKIVKNKQLVLDHVELEKTKTAAMVDLQEKRRLTLKLIEEVRAQIRAIEENTRKETDEIERRRAGYQKTVDEVNQTISKEKQRLVALGKSEEQLSFLQRDASKLDGVKCHPEVDPDYVNEQCRFIKDAVVSRGKISALKEQIAKEKTAIDETVKRYEERLVELRKGMDVCSEQIKAERARGKSSTDVLDEKVRNLQGESNGYDQSIQGIETALVQIRKFTSLRGEVDLAEKEVPGLREESKKLEQQSSNWSSEREKLRAERSKVAAQLEGRAALTDELQTISGELSIAKGRRDESIKKQGGIEAQIDKADELKTQVKKIEQESSDLLTEKAIKGITEDALRAIPFIMVARGIGVVESIANEMLSEISTRGLRVHIETEKITKTTKKVKDEVHLVFQDQDGEKPYKMLSGGEQLRAAFSLRLALSEALAHRRGVRIDCLMADEPFGPLDNEGVDDMKLALREMRKRFGFMGVITHVEKAQDIFPVRFEFRYNQGVSEVSVVDDFQ